jgi:hypothetical protein
MLPGDLEGVAAEGEGPGRVAEPFDVERGDLLLETALPQQDVLRSDIRVLEIELAPVVTADIAARPAG